MDRAEAGGGADTDSPAAMRGLTLPLLAAAADAAKWPLGAPHADSVPAIGLDQHFSKFDSK